MLLSVLCAGASRIAEVSVSRGHTSPRDQHPRSATQQWLQHARPGYCRITEATNSCEGDSGSFSLDACAASTWKLAVSTCIRHCRSCARCTSISVSRSERDCSWFSSAVDCTKLRTDVAGFRSGPVPVPHISELEEMSNGSLVCQLVRSPGLFRDSEPKPCPVNPVLRDDKSRLAGRTRRTTTSRVAFITVMLGTTSSASRSLSSSSTSGSRQTFWPFATSTLPRMRCGGTLTSCGGPRALSQGPTARLGCWTGRHITSRTQQTRRVSGEGVTGAATSEQLKSSPPASGSRCSSTASHDCNATDG